ncbi:hypothetical protein ACQEU5_09990 [Marinactinospora thermotolerans]|uniref:Uncharacterized protein n=1 Tax=Marinactinospora thermotolerans DSM 45154 TaxID=1122192 RepID=A0A1T4N677_9ACTN|nr:hypothetical protein [Marinactinospora thermotolerans]SJZ74809.1 hypothetical protein SAMN02745673_01298 [Marinactinospora thermotolerans DSM 45154]
MPRKEQVLSPSRQPSVRDRARRVQDFRFRQARRTVPAGFRKTRTTLDAIWNAAADETTRTELHALYHALGAAERALAYDPVSAGERLAELRRTVAGLIEADPTGDDEAAAIARPGYTGLSDLDATMARLLQRHYGALAA